MGDYKDAQERADECERYISAINEFEQAKEQLEKVNIELDSQIDNAYALVHDEAMALDETFRTVLETAISEAKAERVEVETLPVELEEINRKTEQYYSADYSAVLEKLDIAYGNLDKSIRQDDLAADISFSAVISVDAEVMGIVEGALVIPVAEPVLFDLFRNGRGIFAEETCNVFKGCCRGKSFFNVKPILQGEMFLIARYKIAHDFSFYCCQKAEESYHKRMINSY